MLDSVVFVSDQSPETTLGPENPQTSVTLSCTVANSGSFEWQWEHNGSPVDTSRSQMWIADATRTSILVVDRLSYSDSGTYTCEVQHSTSDMPYSNNHDLNLNGGFIVLSVRYEYVAAEVDGEEGGSAMLSCEMYGYLTDEIEWVRDGELLQSGAGYAISTRPGDRTGQNGGETTTNSVISDLTVFELEQQDGGTYVCRAKGTTVQRQVDLEISMFQHCRALIHVRMLEGGKFW